MKTCATCKHWDVSVERRADHLPFDAPCTKMREKVDFVVYGDGYIESVDTESDFGCNLHETLDDREGEP